MPDRFLVKITQSAEADLGAIWDYIAADSRNAADRFIADFVSQVSTLEGYPTRCPLIPEAEILQVRYRHFILSPYRAIFRITGNVVLILRIINGARLLDSTMLEVI